MVGASGRLVGGSVGDPAGWRATLRRLDVRFGEGVLATVGEVAGELGMRRPLLVSDPGIVAAGHVARAEAALRSAGVVPARFDGVTENPDEETVERAATAAKAHGADGLIGLGGGSSLDVARGANFIVGGGGRMRDYWGFGKARAPMLPSIGVPCTAGTGSEAQSYAVIARVGDRRKMACGDERARFSVVLLDPELPRTAPPRVVALAGLDALAHAVESHVSRPANPLSKVWSNSAFCRLRRHYELAVSAPHQGAWGELLIGAHLAGCAIEAAMLGAAHACANPLTSRFGVVHGEAVGLMLPWVVRGNAEVASAGYRDLAGGAEADAAERLARELERLRGAGSLAARLRDAGVPESALPALAEEAAEQWTAGFNPKPLGHAALLELYRAAW